MQTKSLYLEDSYLKTCTAKVVGVVDEDKIILDQTVFYPEGGGQPADQGTIKSEKGVFTVNQVMIKDDLVIHEGKLKGEINIGDEVECEIDWDRRYRNMKIHSAGHILHEAVKELLPNLIPIEGQHGKKAYIKYQGLIDDEYKVSIKEKTNNLRDRSLDINTEFVSLDELKARSPWVPEHLPTNKPLRIMWIGNYPPIPDGGTQVKLTSEIPYLATINFEYIEGCTKVMYQLEPEMTKDKVVAGSPDLLLNIKNEAMAMIMAAKDITELDRLKTHYLGKNGQLLKIAREQKAGRSFNEAKTAIEEFFSSKYRQFLQFKSEVFDLSLPGKPARVGLLHPISAVAREMNDIFRYLGFSVADGPEIENDEYNYNRLNLPKDHPARDLQDSLYIKEPDILLRTHTSSLEAHILATHKPPYRFVFPGKSYRYENVSASNHMIFFQYEGIAVGENITMANLKSTLETFIHMFFGPNRKSRFRCKYYPQVEPGIGVDIDCQFCNQRGCSVCKNRGWVEMLGGGMIHPNMFRVVGLDPSIYSGFAWGMGLDRITMARYKLNDIRALFNGNLVYKI